MAYKCSFMDNEVYSAQDVNEVISHLTSGGVVFADTKNVLSDLNTAVAEAVEAGVLNDESSCKVVLEDGVYKISKGVCFMEDGSSICFDEDGYELTVSSGVKNYIYLKRNMPFNTIDIVVSETEGTEGVPLAVIDEFGHITDSRVYARSNVVIGAPGTLKSFDIEFTKVETATTYYKTNTVRLDVGLGDISYLIFWSSSYTYNGSKTEFAPTSKNLIPFSEGGSALIAIGRWANNVLCSVAAEKHGQYIDVYVRDFAAGFDFDEFKLSIGVI